jgi:hypothetical protein
MPYPASRHPRVGFIALAPLGLALLLASGCAEIAYDTAAAEQQRQCDRMVSAPERQLCMERLRTARKQADEQRRKKQE